jgi:ABC-type antimicrobial peptide transport system permease subunit
MPRIVRENILLAVVAFIFTLLPAFRAARLDPIRAIRHL